MRRVGILQDAKAANRFNAAVTGRGLKVELRPEPDGTVAIWVLEEDRLEDARRELASFQSDPAARAFDPPPAAPAPARNSDEPPTARTPWERLPVTLTLIGICVVVAAVIEFGPHVGHIETARRLDSDLSITRLVIQDEGRSWFPSRGLSDIAQGQVWRLVTPIFLHGDPLHLLLNMAWLWLLGSAVESLRGSWRFGLLVLATAIASNLAEYYLNFAFAFDVENGLRTDQIGFDPDPFFLGMSGVVFGLFGFVWMRARLFPGSGFAMPRDTVVWMLIWLVVCTSGLIGPIANVAHGVGLLTGLVIGAAPRLWRKGYPQVAPTRRSERA